MSPSDLPAASTPHPPYARAMPARDLMPTVDVATRSMWSWGSTPVSSKSVHREEQESKSMNTEEKECSELLETSFVLLRGD